MKKSEKKIKGMSPKELFILFFNFIVAVSVYYGCIYIGERTASAIPYQICTGLCVAGAIILPFIAGILSGKIVSDKKSTAPTKKDKAMARTLILWAIPLIVVLLIDMIDLFVVEYLKQLLNNAL